MASARTEPKKLTDRQLANLGRAFLAAKAEVAAAEVVAKTLQSDILAQLTLRKSDELTIGTVRIKRNQSVTRIVDLGELLLKIGRARFNTLITPKLDTAKWHASIQAGNIPADVVEAVESSEPNAPWVRVTEVAG